MDIQQAECKSGGKAERSARNKTPPTLGKMTLEDFLVKAGVVSGEFKEQQQQQQHSMVTSLDSPIGSHGTQRSPPQGMYWLHQYHHMPTFQPRHQVRLPTMVGVGRELEAQNTLSSPVMGDLLGTQEPGRKRVHLGERADKAVERRHMRMIKNRESAARSRARKQAYTNELEDKLSKLEEENEMLRKHKESKRILHDAPRTIPKSGDLRRTSSNSF